MSNVDKIPCLAEFGMFVLRKHLHNIDKSHYFGIPVLLLKKKSY